MTEFMLGEIVKQSPSVPVEQKPLVPLGGGRPLEARTEAENAYEEMTSFYMLNLLLEGKLPAEAVPFYFQKQRDEEIAVATGALYKRIGTDPVSRKFEAIIKAQHDKILAEKYNDPQAIDRQVKMINAKYNGLLNNPQEQARFFANQANELWQSTTWQTTDDLFTRNTRAANLYGMASQLARGRAGAPQQAGADAKIATVRTALQSEAKPAA